MPWFLLSPGISILDSGILFSIHPAATPNPESAENRLAAGVGRARRWLPRSMGHHPTLPPPARLRIPANGSYSRIGKALHDRARPCQVDLPEFRTGGGIRGRDQPAL